MRSTSPSSATSCKWVPVLGKILVYSVGPNFRHMAEATRPPSTHSCPGMISALLRQTATGLC